MWKLCLLWALPAVLGALSPAQELRYRKLLHEFMAPCCWQQRLDVHDSPEAEQVRRQIAERVEAGLGDAEIRQLMRAEFGVRIFPEPPGTRAVALYGAPLLVLAVGAGGIVFFIRRHLRRGDQTS
jgi:cytochrome c-type biogenesis protein CcmH